MQRDEEDIKALVRLVLKEMPGGMGLPLSRDEASQIALAAAKEAVRQDHEHLFGELGYDIANREDIKRLRANLDFLDTFHSGAKTAGARAMMVLITTILGGVVIAMWEGAKLFLTGKY